jgi:hypothetical protein
VTGEECCELVQAIQTAAIYHVDEFFGAKIDSGWLYHARTMLKASEEHEGLPNMTKAAHPHRDILPEQIERFAYDVGFVDCRR